MKFRNITFIVSLLACTACGSSAEKSLFNNQEPLTGEAREAMNDLVTVTIDKSAAKLLLAVNEVSDSLRYPTYGEKSEGSAHWRTSSSKNWVSGFWPGCLWYGYALSGKQELENAAKKWTAGIEAEKFNTHTHDLGFRFLCSFGKGMAFDAGLENDYKPLILTAAQTLSCLWHPEFQAICSDWDSLEARKRLSDYTPCVIDIMMNLELFFWAAQNGGDPSWTDMCFAHANTTWRDFVREDGGTYHVVRYDRNSGKVIEKGQLQGDNKESTWSRGHAWLIYGLTVCYRYAKDPIWLGRAEKAADYFIRNLDADGIANWDFQSNENYTDVSASAVVCSALYELITMLPEGKEKDYFEYQADRMLYTLCSDKCFLPLDSPCLLDHSVRYFHMKDINDESKQNPNIDEPCSFADYYFMEALYRYSNIHGLQL